MGWLAVSGRPADKKPNPTKAACGKVGFSRAGSGWSPLPVACIACTPAPGRVLVENLWLLVEAGVCHLRSSIGQQMPIVTDDELCLASSLPERVEAMRGRHLICRLLVGRLPVAEPLAVESMLHLLAWKVSRHGREEKIRD